MAYRAGETGGLTSTFFRSIHYIIINIFFQNRRAKWKRERKNGRPVTPTGNMGEPEPQTQPQVSPKPDIYQNQMAPPETVSAHIPTTELRQSSFSSTVAERHPSYQASLIDQVDHPKMQCAFDCLYIEIICI